MKIYFIGSMENEKESHRCIVSHLAKKHEVYVPAFLEEETEFEDGSGHDTEVWYGRWKSYVETCDIAVVEGTYPATIHVGFEIAYLLSKKRPVILLYKEGKDPFRISNLFSTRLIKSSYTMDSLEQVLDWALTEVENMSAPRFTFYISPRIDEFLEKIAREKGVSKSEYIRGLIEKEIIKSDKVARVAKIKNGR